jgi:UDP:flavonoid glycosyltransferase YjiC (YdhE family)
MTRTGKLLADSTRPLILCMPNCDVLGHAGRTLRLAEKLRASLVGYRVEFAGRGRCTPLIEASGFRCHDLAEHLQNGGSGTPGSLRKDRNIRSHKDIARDAAEVRQFVEEELRLFRELGPVVVLGDHRYSLATSTQVARLPLISLTNTFFTRYSSLRIGVPRSLFPFYHSYPFLARLHPVLAALLAPLLPLYVRRSGQVYCEPYNQVRREFGLAPHRDLFDLFAGDVVLLPDAPEVCPARDLPANYHHVGMFEWTPGGTLPPELEDERNLIYVSLGSTAQAEEINRVLPGLYRFGDRRVVVTTGLAARPEDLHPLPDNFEVFRFLPGEKALERAALAVHHGGMGALGQCLKAGVPMVCLPGNLEQEVMSHQFVEKKGLGLVVERFRLSARQLEDRVAKVLGDPGYAKRAAGWARRFERTDHLASAEEKIRDFLQGASLERRI